MLENRPLTAREKQKLHPNELEVIRAYEKIMKRKFMRFDLIPLKKCIVAGTPKQIIAMIIRFKNQENFTDFYYLVRPVENMFKNRRGGKKQDE